MQLLYSNRNGEEMYGIPPALQEPARFITWQQTDQPKGEEGWIWTNKG